MTSRKRSKLGFETYSKNVPYAKFILSPSGTKKMVTRGFKKEANRRLAARRSGFINYFIRKQRSI
jgi:hypothetical protein